MSKMIKISPQMCKDTCTSVHEFHYNYSTTIVMKFMYKSISFCVMYQVSILQCIKKITMNIGKTTLCILLCT